MLVKIIGFILLYLFVRNIFRLLIVSQVRNTKVNNRAANNLKNKSSDIIDAEYTVISKE
jgi:UPF0716 family protein affecting phage T7 exclusion